MAQKYPYRFMSPMLMFNTNIVEAAKINKLKFFYKLNWRLSK